MREDDEEPDEIEDEQVVSSDTTWSSHNDWSSCAY